MAERVHWSKLPEVPGFTRVSDEEGKLVGANNRPRRMLQCNECGDIIPSLGVGYHKQGRPCVERKRERLAREQRQADRLRKALYG